MELKDRSILITGATSGIGKAISVRCAEEGASLFLTGRSLSKLNDLCVQLGELYKYFRADLTIDSELDRLVQECPELDGVVFSAGIMKTIPIKFIDRDSIDDIMSINFTSAALLSSKLLKAKKIKSGGSIVFISSIGGNYIGTKGNAIYSSSKGAINAFAKVLALEVASRRIRVNTINPGMVRTEMWDNSDGTITNDQLNEDEKKYPLGYGRPSNVADAAIFLLSGRSRWITGSNLIIDGGFTVQ